MPSQISAGDLTNSLNITSSNDGQLKLTVGPNGSKVDALTLSALGIPTFNQLAHSLGNSGYKKLDGGLIIQWGVVSSSASTSVVVNYPTSFSSAAYVTMATQRTGGFSPRILSTDIGSTTQFTIFIDTAATITCAWIAIGS